MAGLIGRQAGPSRRAACVADDRGTTLALMQTIIWLPHSCRQ
jgi:hypothetical protein